MNGFISAIQFLTRLPIGKPGTFAPKAMIAFFPMVGLMIGGIVALLDLIVLQWWAKPTASVIELIFLIWITGAFHLDGLGDTADGLYGSRPREKALEIMKDSRIGAMGVVAIWCVLSAKWSGLIGINPGVDRSLMLLIIPAYSRAATLFGFKFLEYGRPGGGTGHALFKEPLEFSAFWGVGIPIVLSLFAGWRGLWLNAAFIISTAAILIFYHRRMGCITGDMLGAMTETIEAVLFITAACR